MRLHRRGILAAVCSALTLVTLPGATPVSAAGFDPGPDFNGDGYADLAIGVPSENVGDIVDGGAVEVIYGTATALNGNSPIDDQFWTQASPGVQGTVEANDRFGHALAVGDFDRDGYDDLAIGAPYEDIGAGSNAGVVQVLHGSAAGLTATGNLLLTQDSPGILDVAEAGDYFGFTLEAGNFGGSSNDDLAIGSPYEDVGSKVDSGVVQIVFGSSSGLTGSGDLLYSQDTPGIVDTAESGDHFGWSLAAGRFDYWYGEMNPGDLAIGVPDEDVEGVANAGAVIVVYRVGYSSYTSEQWTQSASVNAGPVHDLAPNDRYGFALTAGGFGRSGESDLAIGIPYEDLSGHDEGAVDVIYGTEDGLIVNSSNKRQLWHKTTAVTADRFGYALVAAGFGRSAYTDLAIGVPGESVGYGLDSRNDQGWTQASDSLHDSAESGDRFGSTLAP